MQKCAGFELLAVCDGHGSEGHDIAEFVASSLAHTISLYIGREKVTTAQSIKEAILHLDTKLEASPLNSETSGTTLCGVVLMGTTLYTFSVGDSITCLVNPEQKCH